MSNKEHKTPVKHPEAKVVKVTPAMAENWLISNIGNRPLNKVRVAWYLDQMRKGLWKLSNDAIAFDTEQRLSNGQHRLAALVQYGKPLDFMVVTGMPPENFAIMDTGKNRSAGDVLGVNEFPAPVHQAAIARFVMAYKRGRVISMKAGTRESGYSNEEVMEFALRNREKLNEVYRVSEKASRQLRGGLVGREVGGLYWVFSEIDKPDALRFFELYGSGENLAATHPIYALRQKFIQNLASRKKYPVRDKIAWTIIAWNKFRKGGQMTKIRWNGDSDDFPKPH